MRPKSSSKKSPPLHPLRALRDKLGSNGKRLSTYKLSELIGVPSPTLRSIETNRNRFTESIQQRFRWRGADWDPKTKTWSFTYNKDLPLTIDLLMAFRKMGRGSRFFQQLDIRAILIQTITLLSAVPAGDYLACVLRLRDFLGQLRTEYKVDGLEDVVAETKPKMEYDETRSGAKFLNKRYFFKEYFPHKEVYNLSYLRTPTEFDEAEHGEERAVVHAEPQITSLPAA